MKKLMKILTKVVYTVVCFSVMLAVLIMGSLVTGSATGESPTYKPSEKVYLSLYIDYIGQKVKLSEVYELVVVVAFRNDEETQTKDMLVSFYAYEDIEDVKLSYSYRHLPIKAPYNPRDEQVYWNPQSTYEEFNEQVFIQSMLFYIYENDSEDFKNVTDPEQTDAYGEAAHKRAFHVDLRRLATVVTVNRGAICASAKVGYNLDYYEVEANRDTIYYATDGEYIAFSKVSADDAEAILTDTPAKPQSFWASLSDLFDGCD